jgi:uncharacterized membrane protein (UPF0136 family)
MEGEDMIQTAQIVLGVYGILLLAGGLIGKVRADSTPSLVAGGLCGMASFYALWLTLSSPVLGLLVGIMLALLLTGIFISRTIRTRKFMPSGLVLAASLIVAIVLMIIRSRLLSAAAVESIAV